MISLWFCDGSRILLKSKQYIFSANKEMSWILDGNVISDFLLMCSLMKMTSCLNTYGFDIRPTTFKRIPLSLTLFRFPVDIRMMSFWVVPLAKIFTEWKSNRMTAIMFMFSFFGVCRVLHISMRAAPVHSFIQNIWLCCLCMLVHSQMIMLFFSKRDCWLYTQTDTELLQTIETFFICSVRSHGDLEVLQGL